MKITRTDLLRPGQIKSETEKLWLRLREALNYDPLTGIWTWKRSIRRVKTGDRAGTINWKNGRRYIKFEQVQYTSYRLAWFYMTGRWPVEIDHEDRNCLNDRWYNLKEVTHSQNFKNSPLRNSPETGRFERYENN